MEKIADFQESIDHKVKCKLCPHQCLIKNGDNGICRVRKNKDGILYTINYGEISSIGVDPIEKKPLYHFYPASRILSLGTFGCNFKCQFCQNWKISQGNPPTQSLTPEEVIELAEQKNVKSIAYTYSEPVVWYEFVKETAQKASKKGLKNVLVTNGFINNKPLENILPYIDAANVDLKSFNDDFYKKYAEGRVEPVKETIKKMANNTHLEITTLLINDLNDEREELKKLFKWISNINKSIPLHLSRYFPAYKMDKPATEVKTMEKAYELAKKYLDFVYLGNLRTSKKGNTYCPQCGKELISRDGYNTEVFLEKGECPKCSYKIKGVFK
ncbi:MAG: AmmeMemoRadiSam system radical SAM enzyme [Bacillota bacterium]